MITAGLCTVRSSRSYIPNSNISTYDLLLSTYDTVMAIFVSGHSYSVIVFFLFLLIPFLRTLTTTSWNGDEKKLIVDYNWFTSARFSVSVTTGLCTVPLNVT